MNSGPRLRKSILGSGAKTFSNSALKKGDIYNEAIKSGAKGLPFLKVLDDVWTQTNKEQLLRHCSAVGHQSSVHRTLDRLRLFIANQLGLIDHSRHSILWVTDFPMFEWNETEQRLEALHHPFTAPNPEDMEDLSSARALAYDMVYNGVEIGGGSLRIYKREVQEKVLEIVGISPEQIGHVVGWATSIRDVVASPKTTTAQCALTRAPSEVDPQQLRDLSFCIQSE
ncbi:aspartate--tRNA ligase [Salix suchowensis]|nr:aspartate--tRNA ligase [Salix suchowensis]